MLHSVQMTDAYFTQKDETLDNKVTKRHYPRNNNKTVLEFVFDKDPNLFLRKNKILIRGTIEIPENYAVENGFASKLFDKLNVEVDSQAVTPNNNIG